MYTYLLNGDLSLSITTISTVAALGRYLICHFMWPEFPNDLIDSLNLRL